MHDRNRRNVEGVSGGPLEGTNPALAQDDLEIAALRDVFSGHQPLFDRRTHAALEHHGFPSRANCLQEGEVLRVPSTYLQHVGVRRDHIDIGNIDDLGDDWQTSFGPYVGKNAKTRLAESLERVGR